MPVGRPDQEPGAYGRSPHGGNRLLGPAELVAGLQRTGFDRCTTASNHSYDLGDEGVVSTIDALESAGMSWSGTARTAEEDPAAVIEVRGVRIAHLSYTRYSNTDHPPEEWRVAYTENPARVAREVTEARAAGAEVVIVSIHLSKELQHEPEASTVDFVRAVLDGADVDAVIHHGPHVVQGFERLDGTPVWWSLGNLVSGMARPNPTDRYRDPRTRDGLAAGLRFTESDPGQWDVAATSIILCNEQASRVVHPGAELADPNLTDADLRRELEGCVSRTRQAVPDAT